METTTAALVPGVRATVRHFKPLPIPPATVAELVEKAAAGITLRELSSEYSYSVPSISRAIVGAVGPRRKPLGPAKSLDPRSQISAQDQPVIVSRVKAGENAKRVATDYAGRYSYYQIATLVSRVLGRRRPYVPHRRKSSTILTKPLKVSAPTRPHPGPVDGPALPWAVRVGKVRAAHKLLDGVVGSVLASATEQKRDIPPELASVLQAHRLLSEVV